MPLIGLGDDERRLIRLRQRLAVGVVDLAQVVAVDLDGMPAERPGAGGVGVAVPAEHRLAALAEPVHIENANQVVELIVSGKLQRLPDRAFGHLAIAQHDPDVIRQLVEVFARDAHADADGQPLAQRAGGHVHPRQHGRGVPFHAAAPLAQCHEFLVRDGARSLVDRIEQRRGVPLREDEMVIVGGVWMREVVVEILTHQHGQQIRRRHG